MRLIVSKNLEDIYKSFILVRSLKEAYDKRSNIDMLIIHNYEDDDFKAGIFISKLKESGVKKFLYINANPITTVRMLINGTGGAYLKDEFYLEDEEELELLLKEMEDNEEKIDEFTSIAAPALNIVTDFIKGFANGDKLINTPMYLEHVNNAINQLAEVTHQQQMQLTAMGTSAINVFEKATKMITNMDQQRKLIEKKLNELELSTANSQSSKGIFGNNIMFFSPYRYLGSSRVCLFREYSPCRYLTSFILGYLNHLHYEKNKRCKLIFVHQKGQGVSLKYSDFTNITQDSMGMMSLYDAEIIATNNPKKEVMKELLGRHDEVIIVVDRLYGKNDIDIVNGRVERINAVGSASDIKRYKIKPEDTIFSTTPQPKEFTTIPVIKNYPAEVDARKSYYAQIMTKVYLKLDKRFHIET